MAYTNSKLVTYTKLSPNHSGLRTHAIDRISPHCVVGQCAIETLGNVFADRNKEASSNYGIGYDGKIGMFVEEKNRSWCTSSNSNDQRAVTIECASDTTEPYTMNNAVYNSLIKLCTDICKRNGKTKLLWFSDKNKALNYVPKSDEMLITVHRWFANKSCPGDWLYARLGDLAKKVTANLGTPQNNKQTSLNTQTSTKTLKGIDLSYANGNVDFSKIDKSQVQFAILRSSFGWEQNQKDSQFEKNYKGFKKLNIPIGVYHYSYARNANEGIKEAEYCLSCIKGKKFELPIYLDMEDNSVTSAGKNNLTNAALAFCQRIEKAGYKAGIYSSPCYIENYIDINKIKMAGYSFWLAEWHDGSPSMNCDVWQHKIGSAGTVKGISGEIDMNYLYNTSILSNKNTTSSSNPVTTKPTNIDIEYQVYANGKWLPYVKNTNDFAGIENKSIQGIRMKVSKGHIKYRVKLVGSKDYLPWVTDTEDYAGIIGKDIDCVQANLVGINGYKVQYRVSTINSKNYLPWVINYNNSNSNGYAGITNTKIDKFQAKIVKS